MDQVSKLKRELDGEILVYGSFRLVHMLLEHDLVDELRLMIYPVVLGAGERLFGETNDKKPMRLVDARAVGEDLAYLILPARPRMRDTRDNQQGRLVHLELHTHDQSSASTFYRELLGWRTERLRCRSGTYHGLALGARSMAGSSNAVHGGRSGFHTWRCRTSRR